MKLLTISDLHGRTVWKEANFGAYDQIIFLGDYTDSYVLDDETIYTNLYEIIQLKQQQPDKVVLLIGNHDAQYIHYPNYRCSGFRAWAQPALTRLFVQHSTLFAIADQRGPYLFTHAGVTNGWLNHLLTKVENDTVAITPAFNLAGLLNETHWKSTLFRNVLFEVGPQRGGYDRYGGPTWADRVETETDYLTGFHQVVGHTPVPDFTTYQSKSGSITYTDVLQTRTAFYEMTIPD